ncbi:hypothetical protein M5K25_010374 [Dendrobium thyrsiflorum]|uniref:Uncharacterized protein n=1 Tax=Dendrobium thyrsiflorum TaxID=117978 RepID=A0ABD0V013_DENTH
MASLIASSSDLTASFMATCLGPSIPNDNLASTFTLPMNTPESRQKHLQQQGHFPTAAQVQKT